MLGRIIRRLLKIILVPVILMVFVLGYLGFIPVVSAMFGSDKPKNLGMSVTDADRISANQKFDQQFLEAAKNQTPLALLRASHPSAVNTTISSSELAAHFMEIHPISSLQIRINSDKSFEASGRIDKKRITRYLQAIGVSANDESSVFTSINTYIPGNPIFYLQGQGQIDRGRASLHLTKAELGRMPLSTGPLAEGLVRYAELLLEKIPNLDLEKLTVADETWRVEGTVPAVFPIY